MKSNETARAAMGGRLIKGLLALLVAGLIGGCGEIRGASDAGADAMPAAVSDAMPDAPDAMPPTMSPPEVSETVELGRQRP